MADFDWGGLLGAGLGAAASVYAAKQNSNAAREALQPQQQAVQQVTANQTPYLNIGNQAAALLGNEDISKLPGYQRGLGQGTSAINRRAAATGGFNSGNRYKALEQFGIDYDQSKTNERQSQLMQLLGVGQGAANNIGNVQTGYANSAARSGISQNNSNMSGLTGALDLASKYLTSKGSNGQTGFSNVSSGLSNLFGGSQPQPSNSFDSDFDYWA